MKYTIEINNVKWDFRFVDETCLPSGYHGDVSLEILAIRVLKTLPLERQRYIIMHELTHALLESQGRHYCYQNLTEEEVCEFMAWNADVIVNLTNYILAHKENFE